MCNEYVSDRFWESHSLITYFQVSRTVLKQMRDDRSLKGFAELYSFCISVTPFAPEFEPRSHVRNRYEEEKTPNGIIDAFSCC